MSDTKDFDPIEADRLGYTREDWEAVSDNPEWTEEDVANARPFRDVFPDLYASLQRDGIQHGLLSVGDAVVLEPDLAARLKATGPGWETRVNDVLRRWIDEAA